MMIFDMMPFGFNRRRGEPEAGRDVGSLFNSLMNQTWNRGMNTDIKDMGDHYLLETELPGVRKEDIKLSLNDDVLTIRAQYSSEKTTEEDGSRYIYRERASGTYQRSFHVGEIRQEDIKARYEDGILKLTLPKREPQGPDDGSIEISID